MCARTQAVGVVEGRLVGNGDSDDEYAAAADDDRDNDAAGALSPSTPKSDKTLCQAVCSVDIYLIGISTMIVGGAGLVLINNISQIVAAIPGAPPSKH